MTPVTRLLCSLLLLGGAVSAQSAETAAATVAAPDLAKGQALSMSVCMACHTNDGSRGIAANPILQGQGADYLAKQLSEFKARKRENAIMNGIAAGLSDADMKNVAAFYASKQAKPGFAKNKDLALAGEKLYRGGAADRAIPACAGCHGPGGAGIPSQYPRLAGQHADYVESQLLTFRSGARHNNVAMMGVAAKLSDTEIKSVADYVTGLR